MSGTSKRTGRAGGAAIAAAVVLAVIGCGAQDTGVGSAAPEPAGDEPAAAEPAKALKPAPEFTLPDLQGEPVSLADFRGKPVVIDFWATWCPPCIFQVPELNRLWKAHREAGDLVVIGVAVDVEGAEIVAPWIDEQGVEYKIVLGDENLAREFGAVGFPTLAIVTPDGEIASLHVGLIELEELESLVAPYTGSG